jgi:hypothetical protein
MPPLRPGQWVFLLFFLASVGWGVFEALPPQEAMLTVIPVGEGRMALIRTSKNTRVLVDAGNNAGVLRALGRVLLPWEKRIDALVLTSPQETRAGGVPALTRRYTVEEQFEQHERISIDDALELQISGPFLFTLSKGGRPLIAVSSTTLPGVYRLR